jgi:hypothetical protein
MGATPPGFSAALLRAFEHAVGGEMEPGRAADPEAPSIGIDAAEERGIEPDVDYGLAGLFGTVIGRSAVARIGDESLGSGLNRLDLSTPLNSLSQPDGSLRAWQSPVAMVASDRHQSQDCREQGTPTALGKVRFAKTGVPQATSRRADAQASLRNRPGVSVQK